MSNAIALALAKSRQMGGQPGEPGLEMPPEMKMLQALSQVAQGYGMGRAAPGVAGALAGQAVPALQGLGEAGAIFPEGAPLPSGDTAALKELGSILPDSQKAYKMNEALANWHASNMDFPAVLKDKWALLTKAAGN